MPSLEDPRCANSRAQARVHAFPWLRLVPLLGLVACGGSTHGPHANDSGPSGAGGRGSGAGGATATSGESGMSSTGTGGTPARNGGSSAGASGAEMSDAGGTGGEVTGAGTGGKSASDDAGMSGGGAGGTGPVSCPADPPADGRACTQELSCSWGTHPAASCRTRASCQMAATGFAWHVIVPGSVCDQPLLPPECPAQPGSGMCTNQNLNCFYADGTACRCGICANVQGSGILCGDQPDGTLLWGCQPPSTVPGCNPLPNEGTGCELPSRTECFEVCAYNFACIDGTWRVLGPNHCSMCADPDTPIATPLGERRIADLVAGDLVYSADHDAIAVVPIARVNRTAVVGHFVIHVELANGRGFSMSAGHPTADGRTMGDLVPNGLLDDQVVESASVVAYEHPYTYDILPASDTGTYFAAGALVGSTLFTRPARDPLSVR